eukprot:Pgem_evm1s11550
MSPTQHSNGFPQSFPLRKAIEKLRSKIKNKISGVHKKMSTWLCSTYKVILKFLNFLAVLEKEEKFIQKLYVEHISNLIKQRILIAKSELFSDCK